MESVNLYECGKQRGTAGQKAVASRLSGVQFDIINPARQRCDPYFPMLRASDDGNPFDKRFIQKRRRIPAGGHEQTQHVLKPPLMSYAETEAHRLKASLLSPSRYHFLCTTKRHAAGKPAAVWMPPAATTAPSFTAYQPPRTAPAGAARRHTVESWSPWSRHIKQQRDGIFWSPHVPACVGRPSIAPPGTSVRLIARNEYTSLRESKVEEKTEDEAAQVRPSTQGQPQQQPAGAEAEKEATKRPSTAAVASPHGRAALPFHETAVSE
ncbi:unnamed protein product [Vitrella brassicaformis CCMP3155]|uniref:Uncharacterized protein n=1 Tax=Vitrella brassicaformis (strain CCMP3155) TaxID=1169540 RepID=A0A0G4G169_VITBC|nr:unnamed protein product [Vitrella brassicaformis CCMP3155]|eukprot:CEM21498.1 unnamed protein product [Vitrella brassicaformis CCMP3155]